MKKEYLLMTGSILLTLFLSLLIIRWFAPQLLGFPADLQMVRTSKEIPPFYSNVFREEDILSDNFLLNDPVISVRAKPLYPDTDDFGPNDILGFRNSSVPNAADIVTIGDSLTYGNNAILEENWPSYLNNFLAKKKPVLYNIATGGWGSVQYLEIFKVAARFEPRVVVIAFYSGNDSLDSFNVVYNFEQWEFLKPDKKISASDMPSIKLLPPESEQWKVRFRDGVETIFTPKLRLIANDNNSAVVRAGYAIMQEAARLIAGQAGVQNIKLVMTVIPTKELVFSPRIKHEGIIPTEDYSNLIAAELSNIEALAAGMKELSNITYVDLVGPLQNAVLQSKPLYPANTNGHPLAAGYEIIAQELAPYVEHLIPEKPRGLVAVMLSKDTFLLRLINNEGVWDVTSEEVLAANGWQLDDALVVTFRDFATLPRQGMLSIVDPARFGPTSENE